MKTSGIVTETLREDGCGKQGRREEDEKTNTRTWRGTASKPRSKENEGTSQHSSAWHQWRGMRTATRTMKGI